VSDLSEQQNANAPEPGDAGVQSELVQERLHRKLVDEKFRLKLAEVAARELDRMPTRFVWLVASPVVLGSVLLIFVGFAWGVFKSIGPSGTTSTALVVGALLVLVPAVLAAWQKENAAEYAQRVFDQAESVVNPPPKPQITEPTPGAATKLVDPDTPPRGGWRRRGS
jgi:hypothetical protein